MTASASETSGDDRAERPPAIPARLNRLASAEPAPGPALRDFMTTEDNKLRDLLAFGMTVEAAQPLGPDGVDGARRKADAALHVYAFRLLHNQVEDIRRQGADDRIARMPRSLSFGRAVLANILAVVIVVALVGAALLLDPQLPARLADQIAQLSTRS